MKNLIFTIALILPSVCRAQWNLPYMRPAVYDYSSWYGDDLREYVSAHPEGFSGELNRAWTFFKSAYIMSNGLVSHMRVDQSSGNVIGTDEAVSEGQGYGLLLAVLNNDQAAFNSIFEAANQQMWDNGLQSYKWDWPGGNGGAADADLDIALALVFADALQKKGLWNTYSGTSYSGRAMDVIRNIYTDMTQNSYLLPGDTWGWDAVNNLNPSYFATAWFRVFNAFQSEIDFTPVINKCYDVVEMMPHYNKGQGSDWITPSGGRAGRGGLGMGNDGIRVPYRIAMDALWFGEPRAIQYCRNTKLTLSAHSQASANLLAQMANYDENGHAIAATGGFPENVAMWTCGVLGSGDGEYTRAVLKSRVIQQITGTPSDYLGDGALQDHKFYYKQAIGMLGLAVITGQFPNVFADMQGDLETGIALTDFLEVSNPVIYFPEDVVFTAKTASPAPWTLSLTGLTSGKTREFTGTGTDIEAHWNGEPFTVREQVSVRLSVTGLAFQSDPAALSLRVQIMSPYDFQGISLWTIGEGRFQVLRNHDMLTLFSGEQMRGLYRAELYMSDGSSLGMLQEGDVPGTLVWRVGEQGGIPAGVLFLAVQHGYHVEVLRIVP